MQTGSSLDIIISVRDETSSQFQKIEAAAKSLEETLANDVNRTLEALTGNFAEVAGQSEYAEKKWQDLQAEAQAYAETTRKANEATKEAATGIEELGTNVESTTDKVSNAESGFSSFNDAIYQSLKTFNVAQSTTEAWGKSVAFATKTFDGLTRAIDRGASIGEISQRMGTNVEALSSLTLAAEQAGVGVMNLGVGLRGFSAMADAAAKGNKEAAAAFRQMGIDARAVIGGTLSVKDALLLVSDKFRDMEDGAQKSALAMQVFGKAGNYLIPMLNEGSAGLKKWADSSKALGLVMTSEQARAMDDAGDAMLKLSQAIEGAYTQIAAGFAPGLAELRIALTEVIAEIGIGDGTLQAFGRALGDMASRVAVAIREIGDRLSSLPETANLAERIGVALAASKPALVQAGKQALTVLFEAATSAAKTLFETSNWADIIATAITYAIGGPRAVAFNLVAQGIFENVVKGSAPYSRQAATTIVESLANDMKSAAGKVQATTSEPWYAPLFKGTGLGTAAGVSGVVISATITSFMRAATEQAFKDFIAWIGGASALFAGVGIALSVGLKKYFDNKEGEEESAAIANYIKNAVAKGTIAAEEGLIDLSAMLDTSKLLTWLNPDEYLGITNQYDRIIEQQKEIAEGLGVIDSIHRRAAETGTTYSEALKEIGTQSQWSKSQQDEFQMSVESTTQQCTELADSATLVTRATDEMTGSIVEASAAVNTTTSDLKRMAEAAEFTAGQLMRINDFRRMGNDLAAQDVELQRKAAEILRQSSQTPMSEADAYAEIISGSQAAQEAIRQAVANATSAIDAQTFAMESNLSTQRKIDEITAQNIERFHGIAEAARAYATVLVQSHEATKASFAGAAPETIERYRQVVEATATSQANAIVKTRQQAEADKAAEKSAQEKQASMEKARQEIERTNKSYEELARSTSESAEASRFAALAYDVELERSGDVALAIKVATQAKEDFLKQRELEIKYGDERASQMMIEIQQLRVIADEQARSRASDQLSQEKRQMEEQVRLINESIAAGMTRKEIEREIAIQQEVQRQKQMGVTTATRETAEAVLAVRDRQDEARASLSKMGTDVDRLGGMIRDSIGQTFDALISGTRDLGDVFEGLGLALGKRLFNNMLDSKLKSFDPAVKKNFLDLGGFGEDVFSKIFDKAEQWIEAVFGPGMEKVGQASPAFDDGAAGNSGGGSILDSIPLIGGPLKGIIGGFGTLFGGKSAVSPTTGTSPYAGAINYDGGNPLVGTNLDTTAIGYGGDAFTYGSAAAGGVGGAGAAATGAAALGASSVLATVGAVLSVVGGVLAIGLALMPLFMPMIMEALDTRTTGTKIRQKGESFFDASDTMQTLQSRNRFGDFTRDNNPNAPGGRFGVEDNYRTGIDTAVKRGEQFGGLDWGQANTLAGAGSGIFSFLLNDTTASELANGAKDMGVSMAEFMSRGLAEGMTYDEMIQNLRKFADESGVTFRDAINAANQYSEKARATFDDPATGAREYGKQIYGIAEIFKSDFPKGVHVAEVALQAMKLDGQVRAFENLDNATKDWLLSLEKDPEAFFQAMESLNLKGYVVDFAEMKNTLEDIGRSAEAVAPGIAKMFDSNSIKDGISAIKDTIKNDIMAGFQEAMTDNLLDDTRIAESFQPVYAVLRDLKEGVIDVSAEGGMDTFMQRIRDAVAEGKGNLQEYIPQLRAARDASEELQKAIEEALKPTPEEEKWLWMEEQLKKNTDAANELAKTLFEVAAGAEAAVTGSGAGVAKKTLRDKTISDARDSALNIASESMKDSAEGKSYAEAKTKFEAMFKSAMEDGVISADERVKLDGLRAEMLDAGDKFAEKVAESSETIGQMFSVQLEAAQGQVDGAFSSAVDAAFTSISNGESPQEVAKAFGAALETNVNSAVLNGMKNAILQAVMDNTTLAPLMAEFQTMLGDALKDGKIDDQERAALRAQAQLIKTAGTEAAEALGPLIEDVAVVGERLVGGIEDGAAALQAAQANVDSSMGSAIDAAFSKISEGGTPQEVAAAFGEAMQTNLQQSVLTGLKNAILQAALDNTTIAPLMAQFQTMMSSALADKSISAEEQAALTAQITLIKSAGAETAAALGPLMESVGTIGSTLVTSGRDFVKEMADALKSDVSSALNAGFAAMDAEGATVADGIGAFNKSMKESIKKSIQQAMIEGMMASIMLEGPLAEKMVQFKKMFADFMKGGITAQEQAQLDAFIKGMNKTADETLKALDPSIEAMMELNQTTKDTFGTGPYSAANETASTITDSGETFADAVETSGNSLTGSIDTMDAQLQVIAESLQGSSIDMTNNAAAVNDAFRALSDNMKTNTSTVSVDNDAMRSALSELQANLQVTSAQFGDDSTKKMIDPLKSGLERMAPSLETVITDIGDLSYAIRVAMRDIGMRYNSGTIPAAAFGGSFDSMAVVGEAGKPELVTALPGGGFRVIPLSRDRALRLMAQGVGGLAYGGTVKPRGGMGGLGERVYGDTGIALAGIGGPELAMNEPGGGFSLFPVSSSVANELMYAGVRGFATGGRTTTGGSEYTGRGIPPRQGGGTGGGGTGGCEIDPWTGRCKVPPPGGGDGGDGDGGGGETPDFADFTSAVTSALKTAFDSGKDFISAFTEALETSARDSLISAIETGFAQSAAVQGSSEKIDAIIKDAESAAQAGSITPEKAAEYWEKIKVETDAIAENAKDMEAILGPLRQAEAISGAISTNLNFSGIIGNLALDPSSLKDTHLAVKDQMKRAVLDGVIQGLLASGPLKAALDGVGEKLNAAIATAINTGDYSGLRDAAKEASAEVNAQMDALAPIFEEIGFKFGDGITARMQEAQGIVASAADNAFKTGASFNDFIGDVKSGVRDKVKQGLMDAFVQSTVMTKTLKPIMDQIDDVFARVGKGDLGMKKAGKELDGLLDDLEKGLNDPELEGLYDKVQGAMERLGGASSVSVEQAFGGAIANAFNNVQSYTDFTQSIRDQLYQQVSDGLINAFMQSAVVQSSLQPILDSISGIFDQVNAKQITIAQANEQIATQVGALNSAMGSPEMKAMFDSVNMALTSTANSLGVTRGQMQQTATGMNRATEAAKNAECAECALEEKLSQRTAGIGAATAMGGSVGFGVEANVLAPKGQVNVNLNRIPRLAMGGILTEATLAVIAENGPEAVVPLNRLATTGPRPDDIAGALADVLARTNNTASLRAGVGATMRSGSDAGAGVEQLAAALDSLNKSAEIGAPGVEIAALKLAELSKATGEMLPVTGLIETLNAANGPEAREMADALKGIADAASSSDAATMLSDALATVSDASTAAGSTTQMSDAIDRISSAASDSAQDSAEMSLAMEKIAGASRAQVDTNSMADAVKKVADASGANASNATEMSNAIARVAGAAGSNAVSTTALSDAVVRMSGVSTGEIKRASDSLVALGDAQMPQLANASDALAAATGKFSLTNSLAGAAEALASQSAKYAETEKMADKIGAVVFGSNGHPNVGMMADKIKQAGDLAYPAANALREVATVLGMIKIEPPPPPPPAAFGGSFDSSAIVGEGGNPELVTALPGGGFRVTPLSKSRAQRMLAGGFGGLKFGGVVRSDSRIVGGGAVVSEQVAAGSQERAQEFARLRDEVRELRSALSDFASATRDRSIVLELDGRVIAENTIKTLERKSRAGRSNLNRVR